MVSGSKEQEYVSVDNSMIISDLFKSETVVRQISAKKVRNCKVIVLLLLLHGKLLE